MTDDHGVDGNTVGQADGVLVVHNVHRIISGELQQSDRLSRPVQRNARRVGVAKIVSGVITARAGTAQRPDLRRNHPVR